MSNFFQPVPNTAEWIIGWLKELVSNNQRHYDQKIAKLINAIEVAISDYEGEG